MSDVSTLCPSCATPMAFKVTEKRDTKNYARRRRKCTSCGYADTFFELNSAQYNQLREDQMLLDRLLKVLDESNRMTISKNPTCDVCAHMSGIGHCTFGFPEAGGSFAAECSSYKELI